MKSFIGLILAFAALSSAHPKLVSFSFFFSFLFPAEIIMKIIQQDKILPSDSFWKDTKVEGLVKNYQRECQDDNNVLSCMKYKILNFLDQVLNLESIRQVSVRNLIRDRKSENDNQNRKYLNQNFFSTSSTGVRKCRRRVK